MGEELSNILLKNKEKNYKQEQSKMSLAEQSCKSLVRDAAQFVKVLFC